ncbi:DUF4261 domain-containing protein [Bacilliculturomica massiliensis]|uniref:DUF4261 domain-containing protein n=1 Tax=Bacilliculturomica massiliensis TaxID=1917867 RepID=UPI001032209D|nr:DUF4261 domain-containing protein [Bacilliculturomica massiliensis]
MDEKRYEEGCSQECECSCSGAEDCGCGCGGTEDCGCGHEEGDKSGHFQGFVLLNSPEIDLDRIMGRLKEEWGVVPEDDPEEETGEEEGDGPHAEQQCGHEQGESCGCSCGHSHVHQHSREQDDPEQDGQENCGCGEDGTLVFRVGNCLAALSLMPAPIPEGEAEYYARANYMWPEAEEVTKTHQAHILAAVLPHGETAVEAGKLFTKMVCACLAEDNAIGVYTSGTVYQPEFYTEVAELMKEDEEELPILDWVYLGLYRTGDKNNAYTYGLTAFGRDEIEVVGSGRSLEELRDFLYQIVCYVICYDVTLLPGETIGFSEEERLPITRSKGAALEGDSLKIEY